MDIKQWIEEAERLSNIMPDAVNLPSLMRYVLGQSSESADNFYLRNLINAYIKALREIELLRNEQSNE